MLAEPRFVDLLEVLVRHGVDFVVVGGIAAILQGAPVMTADVDVVYSLEPENLSRLQAALEEVHAIYRDPAGRRIPPTLEKLATFRLSLLQTDLGPLDVLRTVGAELGYPDLLPRSERFEISDFEIAVLNLETIIETKEFADRPKDRATLPYLREILEMREGGES